MAKCIEYRVKDDIDIEFEDGTITYHKRKYDFLKGEIAHPDFSNSPISKSFPQSLCYYIVSLFIIFGVTAAVCISDSSHGKVSTNFVIPASDIVACGGSYVQLILLLESIAIFVPSFIAVIAFWLYVICAFSVAVTNLFVCPESLTKSLAKVFTEVISSCLLFQLLISLELILSNKDLLLWVCLAVVFSSDQKIMGRTCSFNELLAGNFKAISLALSQKQHTEITHQESLPIPPNRQTEQAPQPGHARILLGNPYILANSQRN